MSITGESVEKMNGHQDRKLNSEYFSDNNIIGINSMYNRAIKEEQYMAWLSDRKEEFNIKRLLGMLGSSDLKKRNRAAREFLKLGMEGAEGLVSTLGSQEVELREITTQILIRLGTQAVPALNNAIQNAPTSIQEEIISILGKMKNQAALEKLFEFLKGENFKLQTVCTIIIR